MALLLAAIAHIHCAGDKLRRKLRNWLSPPDPSINYNIACDNHHKGTTAWLPRGNAFGGWRASGCLFWVHGKRMIPLTQIELLLTLLRSIAGSGKSILRYVSL